MSFKKIFIIHYTLLSHDQPVKEGQIEFESSSSLTEDFKDASIKQRILTTYPDIQKLTYDSIRWRVA